jgi:hypothetical protein
VNAGIVRGLAWAAEAVEAKSPEMAQELRELAAIGAARVLAEQEALERARRESLRPEARAEVEAELERMRSGQVKVYSGDAILRELEEMERKFAQDGTLPPI